MKNKTKLIHTIGSPDKETRSVVQPIHTSTIFAMEKPSSSEGFQYGRVGNPTRQILEATLADLEGVKFAAVFSSGSAAITTLLTTLKSGDHVLCHSEMYEGTMRILKEVFSNFDITTNCVDFKNISQIEKDITPRTKVILFETPTNPSLEILDIQKITTLAHKRGVLTVVDNTIASPLTQLPIKNGADIVIESMTKFLNGHSDVIGGVIATNNPDIFKEIIKRQITLGAILGPSDCHMILRSLKTLHIRTKEQQKTARKLANFLSTHDGIDSIAFPGFKKHKQMKNGGSLISFSLTKAINPDKFIRSLNLIIIGHSFGGVESVIQQPSTMMDLTEKISKSFFRLSIGLEDANDLINDLRWALAQSQQIC